jgi:hypothetical protein
MKAIIGTLATIGTIVIDRTRLASSILDQTPPSDPRSATTQTIATTSGPSLQTGFLLLMMQGSQSLFRLFKLELEMRKPVGVWWW